MRSVTKTRWLIRLSAALSLVVMAAFGRSADAHFDLNMPAAADTDKGAATGGGKGAPPCGPTSVSGIVTTVTAGSMLPISITETVGHPGHYRFAIATTRAGLPADPATTAAANGNSTSAAIESPAVLPVLLDDAFDHTTQASNVQWDTSIQLPPGMTCAKCTLQVIEYMNNHPLNTGGGYFYHHCADLNIVAGGTDAGSGTDARADSGTDTRTGSGGSTGGNTGGQGGMTGTTGQGGATTGGGQGGSPTTGGQGGATGTNNGNAGATGSTGKGGSSGGLGGGTGDIDAGTLPVTKTSGGCSYATQGSGGGGATSVLAGLLIVVGLGLVLRRRRR